MIKLRHYQKFFITLVVLVIVCIIAYKLLITKNEQISDVQNLKQNEKFAKVVQHAREYDRELIFCFIC